MEKLDELMQEFRTSFIWWYFDHYTTMRDPYGYWGQKTVRAMKTDMKLRGKKMESEFIHYIFNVRKYQHDYDCLASMPCDVEDCYG